jgi:lipopolysaccharide/colanic/teichoic acid biosynthesis glycosyltransferase
MGGELIRQRVLILGATPLARELVREIQERWASRFTLVGVVDDDAVGGGAWNGCVTVGPTSRLASLIATMRPHRVVVALVDRRGRTPVRALLEACVPAGVLVEDAVELYERLTGKIALESLRPSDILFSRAFRPSRAHRAGARAASLLIAVIGLILLAPLMAIIALAIKLDSPGPVLFRQARAGEGRRPFTLLKFRTMRVVETSCSEWARDNGDRVTRVGGWLRALRLDELPQFVNILRGEMNVVGPRPHPMTNLALFTLVSGNLNEVPGAAIGYYGLRAVVKPGLTGWAQVRYGYANGLDEEIEKLRYDLYYIKHATPWLDARILWRTLRLLVCARLADGCRPSRVAARAVPPQRTPAVRRVLVP